MAAGIGMQTGWLVNEEEVDRVEGAAEQDGGVDGQDRGSNSVKTSRGVGSLGRTEKLARRFF